MRGFNVMALDKNFQIVSLIRPTNLQWNRKYHESGIFSIQIPLNQYISEMKYIYTDKRPELGKITQVNYAEQGKYRYIQLSGYFLEKDLDRHVAFQNGSSNVTNAPSWPFQSGKAEDVAYAYFNGFKTISTSDNSSDLGISAGTSLGRGKDSIHYRNGEYLGEKIYDILKPSGMSYRVLYDFINVEKKFEVWSGIDRSENNEEGNNPVIFSTKYGNIRNLNILLDDTEYKNACINTNEQTDYDVKTYTSRAIFNASAADDEFFFLKNASMINKNDYSSSNFLTALDNEGMNALSKYNTKVINIDFDAMAGSYEYMQDFDLGDICSIEIPEMNLSANSRLIGCYEVIKKCNWSMTMEFGTPIIIKK